MKKKIFELEIKGSSEMGCYLRDENSFSWFVAKRDLLEKSVKYKSCR